LTINDVANKPLQNILKNPLQDCLKGVILSTRGNCSKPTMTKKYETDFFWMEKVSAELVFCRDRVQAGLAR
jgi:hypothetical protein